ncbi:unnamed protein product [Phytophthora fragariaefolia]|uniref:Unnamed protein product n=1 Tax=Phytophthora fragariaefolia TaxID=1490495 RepID=A0A9W6X1Z6_9STRA|nr:unnamed protein product [Phytophthora fragariaefolia]
MMEGESGTPGVSRLPDEETSFVRRKVEVPQRRQRHQQAKKKRIAALSASVVAMLVFGGVCAFVTIPSGASDSVKAAVSQAMESDPASATASGIFIPSFSTYDEDEDGKISLGEYLDRLAINRDAALKRVADSSLDEDAKARVSGMVKEDFSKHSDCAALVGKPNEDELMTKENFDEVYEEITTGFCPIFDDRIPMEYQIAETAPGKVEGPGVSNTTDASSSASADSEEAEYPLGGDDVSDEAPQPVMAKWEPENPYLPPRPVSDHVKTEGLGQAQWFPIYPSAPPIPTFNDDKLAVAWTPDEPTDPPSASASASQEAIDPRDGVGDSEWYPIYPIDPPSSSSDKDQGQKEQSESIGTQLNPNPTTDGNPSTENGWQMGGHNTYSESTPDTGAFTSAAAITYGESTPTRSNPEAATYQSPFQNAPQAQQEPNAYTSQAATFGATTTIKSGPETVSGATSNDAFKSFSNIGTTTAGEKTATGYNSYTSATNNAGTYQTSAGAQSTTYSSGKPTTEAFNTYNGYSGYNGATANAGFTGVEMTTSGGWKGKRQLRPMGNSVP